MSGVVAATSDGGAGAARQQTELVTPDSQTHITSTNQYALSTLPIKQVPASLFGLSVGWFV